MTDIEIRHFLANFGLDMGAITFSFRQNSEGIWIVTIVHGLQRRFYGETIPVDIIRTEDDLIRWITGFTIRAFASFIPSCIRIRRDPASAWEPLTTRSNHEGLARDQTPGTTG